MSKKSEAALITEQIDYLEGFHSECSSRGWADQRNKIEIESILLDLRKDLRERT